ncbi:hypothetical protein ACQY0O_000321 [Thecaphora frezii]
MSPSPPYPPPPAPAPISPQDMLQDYPHHPEQSPAQQRTQPQHPPQPQSSSPQQLDQQQHPNHPQEQPQPSPEDPLPQDQATNTPQQPPQQVSQQQQPQQQQQQQPQQQQQQQQPHQEQPQQHLQQQQQQPHQEQPQQHLQHQQQQQQQQQQQYQHVAQLASASFATPSRPTPSSHAEAQAALAAVAAAASAGGFQLTPVQDQPGTSYSPAPTTPTPSPFGTHLGRNKACQSCRARKLKCDGQKPVCGQCAKAWAIKFRVAQNKSKNKKKNAQGQDELSKLPDHIPPCDYLPITQRTSSSLAANKSANRPSTPLQGEGHASEDTGSPISAASSRKRKRGDDQSDQVLRMQQEIDELKRQLSQVSELAKLPGASRLHQAQATLVGTSNGAVRDGHRHPSKDELAIAHLLATSMPTGDNLPEGHASTQPQPAPAYAATVTTALGNLPAQSFDGAVHGDANLGVNVLDPALDPAFFEQHDQQPAPVIFHPPPASVNREAQLLREAHAHSGPSRSTNATVSRQVHNEETSNGHTSRFPSPLLELMVATWPADFPPPTTVTSLVATYFDRSVSQGAPLHPGKFMQRLSLGPQHPMFPNRGILHCIFALAYPRLNECAVQLSGPGQFNVSASISASISAEKRNSAKAAAAFHAERAKGLFKKACNEGNFKEATIMQMMLCSYHYVTDESFDAWMTAGTLGSLVKAMELNRLPPARSLATNGDDWQSGKRGAKPTVYRALCVAPSREAVEHEERVRLFWLCFYTDRMACASTFWAQNLDEADILTELPAPYEDWLNQSSDLIYRERQTLHSPDLFSAKHYDPCILHIKALILHSRCIAHMSRLPLEATVQDTMNSAFYQLDSLCSTFLQSFPEAWRNLQGFDPMLMPTDESEPSFLSDGVNQVFSKQLHQSTPQLILAHVLSYGAIVALHEPVASYSEDSAVKSSIAADSILKVLKIIKSARANMGELGSSITLMLVEAARCHARRYKEARQRALTAYLQIRRQRQGDATAQCDTREGWLRLEEELEAELEYDPLLQSQVDPEGSFASLRDDLELAFWFLVKYGEVSPLGVGQAKIVAKLLGKDFSPAMEKRGLFYRSSPSSCADSSSQSGESSVYAATPRTPSVALAASVPGHGIYNNNGGSAARSGDHPRSDEHGHVEDADAASRVSWKNGVSNGSARDVGGFSITDFVPDHHPDDGSSKSRGG